MTRIEAIKALRDCAKDKDIEGAHADADRILCKLLISIGYSSVVEAYHEVPKWYA